MSKNLICCMAMGALVVTVLADAPMLDKKIAPIAGAAKNLASTMLLKANSKNQAQGEVAQRIGSAPTASTAANASISYIGSPSVGAAAPSGKGDPRVYRALSTAGVNFTVDDDGDFRVNWTLENRRTHNTFINSAVSNYSGMELREVWAVGFVVNSIDANNLQALLELNATYKLGAWEVQKKPNGQMWAVFSVKVAADASGEVLKVISNLVAQAADGIEATATHEDKL